MKILKFTTVTQEESLTGPHSVRVPSNSIRERHMPTRHSSDIVIGPPGTPKASSSTHQTRAIVSLI